MIYVVATGEEADARATRQRIPLTPLLDPHRCLDYTTRLTWPHYQDRGGEFFAETHLSTKSAPPP